jgi:hypothetical protein
MVPMRRAAAAAAILLALSACASPPPPTAAAKRLAQNPKAVVEGRVTDEGGRPVEGVLVQAIPGGRDIEWSAAEPTDAAGRFRLSLDAPAEYVFLIFEGPVAVVTSSVKDPARVRVFLQPGEIRKGVELTLLSAERKKIAEP